MGARPAYPAVTKAKASKRSGAGRFPQPKDKFDKLSAEQARRVEQARLHRRELSHQADQHWAREGAGALVEYLRGVQKALAADGFTGALFQWRHSGQALGLMRDDGKDHQIHVRLYENGVIDAERELHKRYVQHLYSPRPSAHEEVIAVLEKHGIMTDFVNRHYLPQVGSHRTEFPTRRTRVSALIGSAAGIVGGALAYRLARRAFRKTRRRLF